MSRTKRALSVAAAGLALAAPAAVPAQDHGPEIHLYSAFGTSTRFTVRGRVLEKSGELDAADGAVSKNLRRLLRNAEWKHVGIRVTAAGHVQESQTDEEGMFEVVFAPQKAPDVGMHPMKVEVPGRLSHDGQLRIVGKGELIVVSDYDDTVVVSDVTDKAAMLKIALTQTEETQAAAPGMADFYGRLAACAPPPVFVYLSGSPVQFQPRIKAFLERNGFPAGQTLLRKLGPGNLDSGGFKTPWLERLLADFPENRFVFIGDSGEKDPEVYREAAKKAGARAAGVFIRLVTDEAANSPRFAGMKAFRDPAKAVEAAGATGVLPDCPEARGAVPGAPSRTSREPSANTGP